MLAESRAESFFGRRVVAGAFVLAAFGWGMGFYGPPVFLNTIHGMRGWPLALIATAITVHYLAGAVVVAQLPWLYKRFGIPAVTKAAAISLAIGVVGWANAAEPWQMFVAALFSGGAWCAMSAAGLNAIVSPWYVRTRPAALAMAYNGGSVGGIIFSPLWVASIGLFGFANSAAIIGAVMLISVWLLAEYVFSKTPESVGQVPDGDAMGAAPVAAATARAPLTGSQLWGDRRFLTLAAGMFLGLFAQIGLMSHLFSLLVPALGAQRAGLAMALVTVLAIAGRTLLGWLMPYGADRRLLACAGYVAQLSGSLTLLSAGGTDVPLLLVGVVLFGAGFGNATSLPPLVAQVEFAKEDVQRVVSLIIAMAQAGYAFSPAIFGLIRAFGTHAGAAEGAAPLVFAAAALVQALAGIAFLAGRRR